ncbi:hypothetical protein [Marinithermofilum abyssi]|uniref:hypothetical protein n=1 Tax=Marinithermofilum abyssi TaxID=1571185 RepID=UPI001665FAEA|nr:hypothetical protein [Marinithermofilum abyssi]
MKKEENTNARREYGGLFDFPAESCRDRRVVCSNFLIGRSLFLRVSICFVRRLLNKGNRNNEINTFLIGLKTRREEWNTR